MNGKAKLTEHESALLQEATTASVKTFVSITSSLVGAPREAQVCIISAVIALLGIDKDDL